MTKKILKEGLDWKFGNQWILLTFLSISQPRLWSLPDAHWPWQPGPCPLTWNSSWNMPWPVSSHQAASWPSSEPQLRLKASRSPPTWVSCFSSQAPQLPVLLTIMVFTLFYNGPFMCLFPALPDWELRQTREHVLFMAESASLGHSGHTVNLLTKRTNNWIRAPLLSVASNQGNQRTNTTHWLHWLFLKLPHPRLQVGPPSLQLFRAVFTSPCSHAFICAFAKGKCRAEQGTWWWVTLQNRADGTKPCIHCAQWGKGSFAYWWPPALLTIWYIPKAKCLLQLWKIFSLTSNLTINNFFIVFSHHGAQRLLRCFTERAVCQALTCLAQGAYCTADFVWMNIIPLVLFANCHMVQRFS